MSWYVPGFELPSPVAQAAGVQYAFELGLTQDGFTVVALTRANQYRAGSLFTNLDGGAWSSTGREEYDIHFQTFVPITDDAAPEITFVTPASEARYRLREGVEVAYSWINSDVRKCPGAELLGS